MSMEQRCNGYGCTVIRINVGSIKPRADTTIGRDSKSNQLRKTRYTLQKVMWVLKTENRKTPVLKKQLSVH